MKNLKRIDVLLNLETGERFDVNDIVKIEAYNRKFIGRIEYIDTSELVLDTSKEYESNFNKIKFDDITAITKYE